MRLGSPARKPGNATLPHSTDAGSGSSNRWARTQRPRGVGKSDSNSSRNSSSRVRGQTGQLTSDSIAEASAKKLHDTLLQAEAEQTANWVRTQHEVRQWRGRVGGMLCTLIFFFSCATKHDYFSVVCFYSLSGLPSVVHWGLPRNSLASGHSSMQFSLHASPTNITLMGYFPPIPHGCVSH